MMNKIVYKLEYFIFLVVLVGLGVTVYASQNPHTLKIEDNSLLEVTVFDIGQGDAIFVKTPEGRQMLVDGGPDDTILSKLGETMPLGDRDIDLVVLTHPHADHLAGLVSVLERYRVGRVIITEAHNNTAVYAAFTRAVKETNTPQEFVEQPEDFDFGGITVHILYPFEKFEVDQGNLNESSMVIKLEDGSKDILLTGDADGNEEGQLVERGADLRADVLKVGHHGSKTSTSPEFLEKVDPEVAVISVGENSYGHPHPTVLSRLKRYGTKIFRTDEDGDVIISTDGSTLNVYSRGNEVY